MDEEVVELGLRVGREPDRMMGQARAWSRAGRAAAPGRTPSARCTGGRRPSRERRTPHVDVGDHRVRGHAAVVACTARTRPSRRDALDVRPEAQLAAERGQPAREREHELVHPTARMPGAERVLDVPGDGQRGRHPARIAAGVAREALDDHPQARVAAWARAKSRSVHDGRMRAAAAGSGRAPPSAPPCSWPLRNASDAGQSAAQVAR